jgi:hypothetical protein
MVSAVATPYRHPGLDPRLAVVLPPLAVAALVVVNAWAGVMPGVGFWDTGEFQTVLPILGTAHPTGYPTYVILGFIANLLLAPLGEPAFRINLLSLLAVAVAAGATTILVRRLTGSTIVGVAVGLGLATTPLVWLNATRADPHPIHLALVALLLVALVRWEGERRSAKGAWNGDDTGRDAGRDAGQSERRADRWLVLAAVIFGLAAGNHSLTLLLVPPIGVYVLAVDTGIWRRWRFALACLAAAALTIALIYLELPLRGGLVPRLTAPLVYAKPDTWDGFWYIALAEQFRGSLGDPFADLGGKLDKLVALASGQYGLLALAIPPAFVVSAVRRPRYALLTGLAFLITVLFNAAYSNADIQRYYLGPFLWVWTWLGILAAELARFVTSLAVELAERLRRVRLGDLAVEQAGIAAALVLGAVLLAPTFGDLDQRRHDAGRADERDAQAWLGQVLPVIPDNAVLVSWWSTSTPLWYAQKVEGLRSDIFIVDDRTMLDLGLGRAPDVIRRYLGERPVYVIRLTGPDTDELTALFDMHVVAGGGNLAVWAVTGELAAAR